jgi:ABC-type polar amino acid transport system ATPase subunit
MLAIKNVTKIFNGKKVIDAISLTVERGHIAVLLGQSGVGKSTMLRVLNNLESVDAGTLELDGNNLNLKNVHQEHTVGMVFQHFNLFDHMSVLENITFVLEKVAKKSKDEAHAQGIALLTKYGLAEKAAAYPQQLSGGQKQRLAIARALSLKPTVVCMDEPTSALDPLLTTYVAQNIKELANEGYIVVVASHDISLLEKLPCTIYLMSAGKIVEKADSHNFYADKNRYPLLKNFVAGV